MQRKYYLYAFLVLGIFISLPARSQTILTVDKAIKTALENSPNIRRSYLNLVRSKESLKAQNAALKSKFRLQITPFEFSKDRQFNDYFSEWYSSENKQSYATFSVVQPIIWTDGTLALNNRFGYNDALSEVQDSRQKTFSNNLYLSFDQPLFTYNRTKMQLTELELDFENAALSYAIQKLAITKNVSESFYNVFQQKMKLQIAKDEYESQKKNYELTQNKVDAGILSKDELYQAELNMLNSQMSYQNEEVTLENNLDQFKQLIGIPIDEQISIVADISPNRVDVSLTKAINNGVQRRMELRQREIDIQNSENELTKTTATNEFFGKLSLSVGLIGTNEKFKNVYATPADNQRFSLSFDIPLFDWGEREHRLKAAETSIETSKLSLDDERTSILVAIKSVYRNLQNLDKQIDISKISERNAQLSYDINLERYSNGDLTSIDLQRFQTQLSQAKLSKVQSLINYKLALLDMKIQSLWDFENDKPVVPDLNADEEL
ncbi:MAG: TolC family protein [Chlorobi bacterium]|nr:TolC family protein [Chlorobiota bacterium]